jgi:hypothetical protein
MEITNSISEFFTAPLQCAKDKVKGGNGAKSVFGSLSPRALLVVQFICSLVAIKCLFWAALVEICFNYLAGLDWQKSVGHGTCNIGYHLMVAGGSLVGVAAGEDAMKYAFK